MLVSCSPATAKTKIPVSPTVSIDSPTPTITLIPTLATATSTPDPRLPPERWQEWPVVPDRLSPAMLEVYKRGQELGNNQQAFSKIGDGGVSTVWFLSHYDLGPAYYDLGEYADLQPVIDYFAGSFGRLSLAAGRG